MYFMEPYVFDIIVDACRCNVFDIEALALSTTRFYSTDKHYMSDTLRWYLPLQSCLARQPPCIAVKLSPAANMTNGVDK